MTVPKPAGQPVEGRYTQTPSSNQFTSDGEFGPVQLDAFGNLKTGWSPSISGSVGALPGTVKASPGFLFGVNATNRNASARYLQLFNSIAGPSGVPLASFLVPANTGSVTVDKLFGQAGTYLSVGISLGVSTSSTTYVAASAADVDWTATFA